MMEYKRLIIDSESESAYLIGYRIPLTPSEFKILSLLTQSIVSSGAGMSTSELIERYSDRPLMRSNVTVHICSINKKARAIGARPLITFCEGYYYLNEYM